MNSSNRNRSYDNCMSDNNISKAVLAIYYDKQKRKLTKRQFAFMLQYHPDLRKKFEIIESFSKQQEALNKLLRNQEILEQQIKERYFKGE